MERAVVGLADVIMVDNDMDWWNVSMLAVCKTSMHNISGKASAHQQSAAEHVLQGEMCTRS